jgi:hypothetical protein
MGSILLRGNAIRYNLERLVCASERSHVTKQKRGKEDMSQKAQKDCHCSKIVIEGLVYLTLTPVVIQSRNAAKMNGSQPDWDARES